MSYIAPGIEGWMSDEELAWLHATASGMASIAEVGSWKGRSTHALLTGCTGIVTAIDHFDGGAEVDCGGGISAPADVFDAFLRNVGDFENLEIIKRPSAEAATFLKGRTFEMVFIDAAHDYESVRADILLWRPLATRILCGHDYSAKWPGVRRAVDELLGTPDELHGSIWVKRC